jgi:hypothetical protein
VWHEVNLVPISWRFKNKVGPFSGGAQRGADCGRVGEVKAPNSNIQAPEKLKTPNYKLRQSNCACLELEASLDVGAWCLEFILPLLS